MAIITRLAVRRAVNLMTARTSRVSSRRLSSHLVLCLQRWLRFYRTILWPRNLLKITFTDETTANAVIAFEYISFSLHEYVITTHIQASLHRTSSSVSDRCRSQSWFDSRIASSASCYPAVLHHSEMLRHEGDHKD